MTLYLIDANSEYTKRQLDKCTKQQVRLFECLYYDKVEQLKEFEWDDVYSTMLLFKIMGLVHYEGNIVSGMQWEQLLDSGIKAVSSSEYHEELRKVPKEHTLSITISKDLAKALFDKGVIDDCNNTYKIEEFVLNKLQELAYA